MFLLDILIQKSKQKWDKIYENLGDWRHFFRKGMLSYFTLRIVSNYLQIDTDTICSITFSIFQRYRKEVRDAFLSTVLLHIKI